MGMPPRYDKLLNLLALNRQGLTSKQVSDRLKASYQVVARDLADLHKKGIIERTSLAAVGIGYSWLYKYKGLRSELQAVEPLSPEDILAMWNKLASLYLKNEPTKTEEAIQQLPRVVNSYVTLACRLSIGEVNELKGEARLSTIRDLLKEIHETVQMLATNLHKFLSNEFAWNALQLGSYLLDELEDEGRDLVWVKSQEVEDKLNG